MDEIGIETCSLNKPPKTKFNFGSKVIFISLLTVIYTLNTIVRELQRFNNFTQQFTSEKLSFPIGL